MKQFVTRNSDVGRRLDVVVAELYPDFSRSSLESLFSDDLVEIGSRPAKPSHKLKYSDVINIDDSRLEELPPAIQLPVLYEDDNVIVVDKPAGVLTHSKGPLNLEATVASFIRPKLKDEKLTGNRAGIVHRLDRQTSGVIITAKSAESQRSLQRQFSQRKVQKTYIAIVEGVPKPKAAVIEAPTARNPKKPQTFSVQASGKPTKSQYNILKSFEVVGKTYSKVELKPETGRTHQLRVHMAYIGHPIVGDSVYGHKGTSGLLLHATELSLTLPDNQHKVLKSRLPARFKDFIENDR